MPDASMDATLSALVSAGFGAAGQRCMALSTAVFVGGSVPWEEELVEHAKALKVNAGTDPGADIGPVISKEVKDRINRLVQSSVDSGARLLLDGRNVLVPGYENGNFVGPTILCDVTMNMECYKEEIFGPVLLCMQADCLEEAINIANRNRSMNGISIFTTSGYAARKFQSEIEAGLIGINVPVPFAMPWPSFNGPRGSFASDLNFCGKSGIQFYTQIKTIAQQWRELPSLGVSSALPPSSETDMTSRGVSSLLPMSSGRDSLSQRASSAMSPASESNSPGHRLLLPIPTSERDLQNPGVSSLLPTTDGDISSEAASLAMPPSSEMDLPKGSSSLVMPPATERDLPSQGVQLATPQVHGRMYTAQTSQWNEALPQTSQRREAVPAPSEIIYMRTTSQINGAAAPSSQRTDNGLALTHDSLYMPASQKNETVVSTSRRTDAPVGTDRIFMLATSHLNENMGQTFQKTDATMFPTSERIYMAAASQRNDMGTTSQSDIGVHPTSESLFISATPRMNDNIASTSHCSDTVPSTSERMYMPPLVQRNAGVLPPSERLYMPATSRTIYTQNPIISLDEFPSQGPPSVTLPTSQRI